VYEYYHSDSFTFVFRVSRANKSLGWFNWFSKTWEFPDQKRLKAKKIHGPVSEVELISKMLLSRQQDRSKRRQMVMDLFR